MLLETMSVHVNVQVLIFITRLKFPSGLSIIEVLRNRYGPNLVKMLKNWIN